MQKKLTSAPHITGTVQRKTRAPIRIWSRTKEICNADFFFGRTGPGTSWKEATAWCESNAQATREPSLLDPPLWGVDLSSLSALGGDPENKVVDTKPWAFPQENKTASLLSTQMRMVFDWHTNNSNAAPTLWKHRQAITIKEALQFKSTANIGQNSPRSEEQRLFLISLS